MSRNGQNISGLRIPSPGYGGDTGLNAANAVVTSLDAIDNHDHTSTNGKKIPSAAINIDQALSFNGQAMTNLDNIQFQNTTTPVATRAVYVKSADLYFKDGAGNEVRLTTGGNVNVTGAGSLTGIPVGSSAAVSYSAGSLIWAMVDENGAAAKINGSSLLLSSNSQNLTFTFSGSASASYTLTYPPTGPTASSFLLSDASGNLSWQKAVINEGTVPATNKIPYWSSSTTLTALGPLTNGQLIVGSTGNAPVAATLTGTANRISVTNGSGSITLTTPQDLHTGASVQFSQLTLSTLTGNPTAGLGNTTVTGTLNISGNATFNTLTGTGSRVVVSSAVGLLLNDAAIDTNATASTIVKRDGSGNITGTGLIGSSVSTTTGSITTLSSTAITATGITLTGFNGVLKASSGTVSAGVIDNSNIAAGAGIIYSKLNLSGSIVNADIASGAGIVDTKLATISTAGKVSNSATTATSSNTVSAIVARDSAGNFSAGTITASLNGNATTATSATTATTATNVSGGTASVSTLMVSGYSSLGGSSPALAIKKITGSWGPGVSVINIGHSISPNAYSRIKTVFGKVEIVGGGGTSAIPGYSGLYARTVEIRWDNSTIDLFSFSTSFVPASLSSILSSNYTLYIVYEDS